MISSQQGTARSNLFLNEATWSGWMNPEATLAFVSVGFYLKVSMQSYRVFVAPPKDVSRSIKLTHMQ